MNVLKATRTWMRDNCSLIDKKNRFNANYLGTQATEYSIGTSSVAHHVDICGKDHPVYTLVFFALMDYGAALSANIAAVDFFEGLSDWITAQNRAHNYPSVDGFAVTEIKALNPGLIVFADANAARYQLQLQLTLEEE